MSKFTVLPIGNRRVIVFPTFRNMKILLESLRTGEMSSELDLDRDFSDCIADLDVDAFSFSDFKIYTRGLNINNIMYGTINNGDLHFCLYGPGYVLGQTHITDYFSVFIIENKNFLDDYIKDIGHFSDLNMDLKTVINFEEVADDVSMFLMKEINKNLSDGIGEFNLIRDSVIEIIKNYAGKKAT